MSGTDVHFDFELGQQVHVKVAGRTMVAEIKVLLIGAGELQWAELAHWDDRGLLCRLVCPVAGLEPKPQE